VPPAARLPHIREGDAPAVAQPQPDPGTLTQHQLDVLKVGVAQRMPGAYLASSIVVDQWRDMVINGLVLQLTGHVLGKQLPPLKFTESRTVTIDVPASWWQHLKRSALGVWGLRRLVALRPPRMRPVTRCLQVDVNVSRAAAFPEASLLPADPRLGAPVLILGRTIDTRLTQG
jgi:hypothetical protein